MINLINLYMIVKYISMSFIMISVALILICFLIAVVISLIGK